MGTRNYGEGQSSSEGGSRMNCTNSEVPAKKVRCAWQIRGKCRQRTDSSRDEPRAAERESLELASYLQIWQVEQLGRSCIDNLMNRALEDAQGGRYAREESVEDTAVLAAIHNHGLQVPGGCQSQLCVRPLGPPVSQPLEHTTFIDAAVTAAIQRKGLCSLSAADL